MEEDKSWLSSVIDRVDKLALSIVGYENDAPEYSLGGFSDDESDSNSSEEGEDSGDSGFEDAAGNNDDDNEEDSGFEDAIASPRRPSARRPQAENGVEHGGAEDASGRTEALEDMRQELHSELTPAGAVSSSDKASPIPVAHSRSRQEHPDIVDVQRPSEEATFGNTASGRQASSADETTLVSITPSHSQDPLNEADMPGVGGAPSRQEGGADGGFIPAFCTPAHGRDRNASNQAPPMPAVPTGSGTGSRRAHRARHRNEGLGASSSAGIRRHTGEEPAPVHASPPPSASLPTKALNRPPRSTEKKFSYVGDKTWLKPSTDSPEAASFPLEQREVAVAGESASAQKNTSWTPAVETPASNSWSEPQVGTVDDAPILTARRNRYQSPSEIEQQLELDHDGAEIDSQASVVAEEALDIRTEDGDEDGDGDGGKHEEGTKMEEIASECSEDSLTIEGGQEIDLPNQEQEHEVGANGHRQRHEDALEECGGTQGEGFGEGLRREGTHAEEARQGGVEDAVEPPHLWTEEVTTVGAKRASVENVVGAQGPGWTLDSPEGLAPSKRGKTQLKHHLAVMRHSVRLDDALHERQRKREAMMARTVSEESVAETDSRDLDNGDGDELSAIPWPDKAQRPYDSPIVDTNLPAQQAKELSRLGMGSQTFIVCSPFRRCLQTAGVVARTLGVASVTVHLEVGERMDKVRKEIAELTLANEHESDGTLGNSQPAPVFSYLEEKGMREALGKGVQLERILGEQPPQDESGVEAKQRFIATIAKVREEQLRESPVLVVAHGDTLDAAGESLASQIVFEADYCAWAMFDLDTHCGYVTESYGIQMIPL